MIETELFRTEQEKFWAGDFGELYTQRNESAHLIASNLSLFSKVLSATQGIKSCIEYGANVGMNLKALQLLCPGIQLEGVEINRTAAAKLAEDIDGIEVHNTSLLEFQPKQKWDLVVIKGVLIHLNPDVLHEVYELLFRSSARYILIAEYYSPTPVSVQYRGHSDRLFKRDFAGELMDQYSQLRLVDYGFLYHRDVNFPQDDINWFLLEQKT